MSESVLENQILSIGKSKHAIKQISNFSVSIIEMVYFPGRKPLVSLVNPLLKTRNGSDGGCYTQICVITFSLRVNSALIVVICDGCPEIEILKRHETVAPAYFFDLLSYLYNFGLSRYYHVTHFSQFNWLEGRLFDSTKEFLQSKSSFAIVMSLWHVINRLEPLVSWHRRRGVG